MATTAWGELTKCIKHDLYLKVDGQAVPGRLGAENPQKMTLTIVKSQIFKFSYIGYFNLEPSRGYFLNPMGVPKHHAKDEPPTQKGRQKACPITV